MPGYGTKPPGGWLGSGADEGRGKRRYARGRRMQPLNPGSPNGTSRYGRIARSVRETRGEYSLRGVPNGNPPNGNILVGGGKETKRDPLSRGDRKGESPNQIPTG